MGRDPSAPMPTFYGAGWLNGVNILKCNDDPTRQWPVEKVPQLEALWEGAKQEAVDRELIPSIPKAKVLFPIALQGERALKLLQRQNPGVLESEEKPLMEASCYMAHDRPAPQDELGSLVTEAGPKNHQLIISTDSNAHQNVWGSPDIKVC
uniref:Uncharacterized protein, isoform A n=1 Tax=Drosophila pseudoobscura pseudoobscura TaxID=46245 RepID=A0A0R3NVY2_DROPS